MTVTIPDRIIDRSFSDVVHIPAARRFLIVCAKRKWLPWYSDLSTVLGRPSHRGMGDMLDAITIDNIAKGEPHLATLVCTKDTDLPDLRSPTWRASQFHGEVSDKELERLVREQQRECFNYWAV